MTISKPTLSTYQPKEIEEKWYGVWEREGYFQPTISAPESDANSLTSPSLEGSGSLPLAINNGEQQNGETTTNDSTTDDQDSEVASIPGAYPLQIATQETYFNGEADTPDTPISEDHVELLPAPVIYDGAVSETDDLSHLNALVVGGEILNGLSKDLIAITNGDAIWRQCGVNSPSPSDIHEKPETPVFSIIAPPQNITGNLHYGHALAISIQDLLARWHRMRGFNTLFTTGTNHAGLATEWVIAKKILLKKNRSRLRVGPHVLLYHIKNWQNECQPKIRSTCKRLGASIDWDREAYTMDEQRSAAVSEAFVRLHQAGFIRRERKVVHWSTELRTTLTDSEVHTMEIPGGTFLEVPGIEDEVQFGMLYYFKYWVVRDDGTGFWIYPVARRPELLLADTGIAVHPADERYTDLVGLFARHPFSNRLLEIVTDSTVDPRFGTGMVTVAPAHDHVAAGIASRNRLESVVVFKDDGSVNDMGESFEDQDRFAARLNIIESLKVKGLYIKEEPCDSSILICNRTGTIIEPMLKPQWWLKTGYLSKAAKKAVEDGKIKMAPKSIKDEFLSGLDGPQEDLCISRQTWLGHKIPWWLLIFRDERRWGRMPDCWDHNRLYVAMTEEEAYRQARKRYAGRDFELEPGWDVMDSWFSAAIWPLAVLGWPKATPEFKEFYPTSILTTGADTLSWVTRTIMLSLELTGEVPFREVYFHPLFKDIEGVKMSKSAGNVIDPIDFIEGSTLEDLSAKLLDGNLAPDTDEYRVAQNYNATCFPNGFPECGADALRFALIKSIYGGMDVFLDIDEVAGCREFCNSIYEVFHDAAALIPKHFRREGPGFEPLETSNMVAKYVFHLFSAACQGVNEALKERRFSNAAAILHDLWINQIRDQYLVRIKSSLPGYTEPEKASMGQALFAVIDGALRLTHPFMPFITEELWQKLPHQCEDGEFQSIMVAPYPDYVPEENEFETEGAYGALVDVAGSAQQLSLRDRRLWAQNILPKDQIQYSGARCRRI
ncbi:valine--tRNA ligase [Orbilia brochopaga]|uniref:valine--tRNA ligase n=1 Tax=Orbilia brochopaga TaxID=3140254 RepID=A0AAV9UWJ9_9PEZI